LEKEEILKKKKLDRFKGALGKQNEIIDEIRKEVYGNNDNEVKNYNNADIEEIRREIYGDGSNNIENKNTNKISPPQTNFNINENESNLNKIDIKNKPKWAMTKEESEKVNDKELDDLLNFAQNLDYEKYIKDLEIREALGIIKK